MDIEKKTIAAEAGQSFVVSLESMPGSTGFSWALSRLETGLLLTGEDTQQHMSGGCGHVVQAFSFIAVKAGEFHLGFQLVRPWVPATPGREIDYVVKVSAPAAGDELKASMGQFSTQASLGDASCCPPVAYYAVFPPPGATQVLKYGFPPNSPNLLKYGMPPIVRYGFPPQARYAAPQQFQSGTPIMPYGVLPDNGCC
jgi:hypothetical protein